MPGEPRPIAVTAPRSGEADGSVGRVRWPGSGGSVAGDQPHAACPPPGPADRKKKPRHHPSGLAEACPQLRIEPQGTSVRLCASHAQRNATNCRVAWRRQCAGAARSVSRSPAGQFPAQVTRTCVRPWRSLPCPVTCAVPRLQVTLTMRSRSSARACGPVQRIEARQRTIASTGEARRTQPG